MRNCSDHRGSDPVATMIQSGLGLDIDCSLTAVKKYKDLELELILASSCHQDRDSARALLAFRQVVALLAKNPSLRGSSEKLREAEATKKFLEVEAYQRIVTRRLRWFLAERPNRLDGLVHELLFGAKHEIFRLLGPGPTAKDFGAVLDHAYFGPGSVQGLFPQQGDKTPWAKLHPNTRIDLSLDTMRYWGPLIQGPFRDWLNKRPAKFTEYCRAAVVPKDAATDRFIAVEPYLNSWIQLGQNAWLSGKLRHWDVDLRDQTRNQTLAFLASRPKAAGDGWATIDLSSASDSMNVECVRFLLGPNWFKFFDSTRCKDIRMPNKTMLRMEKFSSMGNGNTFPLETLIFTALVRSAQRLAGCKLPYAVFGDDIIVSQRCSLLVVEGLKFLGFKTNGTKTFYFGSFRESCGCDFLAGHPVRPFYWKKPLSRNGTYLAINSGLQARDNVMLARLALRLLAGMRAPKFGPLYKRDQPSDAFVQVGLWALKALNGATDVTTKHPKKDKALYQTHKVWYWAESPAVFKVSQQIKEADLDRAYLSALCQGMRLGPHLVRVPHQVDQVRVGRWGHPICTQYDGLIPGLRARVE